MKEPLGVTAMSHGGRTVPGNEGKKPRNEVGTPAEGRPVLATE